MSDLTNIVWAIVYSLAGGAIGILMIFTAVVFLPRMIDKLTPGIDEEKEMLRGNRAVADYFGRIVSASIIAIGIIIGAAILGGILAGLY